MTSDVSPSAAPAVQSTPVGTEGTRIDIAEEQAWSMGPALPLLVGLVGILGGTGLVILAAIIDENGGDGAGALIVLGLLAMLIGILALTCLTVVQPGTTKVLTFFGRYVGTVRRTGMCMVRPFTSRKNVSVRVRNFETGELKVNDADGNPINIGTIVVWQVADTAKATFAVDDYQDFVEVQAESALRHVATSHPYDNADEGIPTLRGSTDLVSTEIAHEVAERVTIAGVEVVEARISKLAYAPEIAQAMLQRQQAGAIIAAREKIVEGAVSMVESALSRLEAEDIITLDDERKAAMVSNLLVVLCGDSRATPVVNAGSLYT